MLRFVAISLSLLFLLLFGAGNSAKASSGMSVLAKKLADKEGKNQSGETGELPKSQEKATGIDFFGAFSLVNVQLQWRDLHADLNDESTEVESLTKGLNVSQNEVETSLKDVDVMIATEVVSSIRVDFPSALAANQSLVDSQNRNQQTIRTIAYILNCGTYPHVC